MKKDTVRLYNNKHGHTMSERNDMHDFFICGIFPVIHVWVRNMHMITV